MLTYACKNSECQKRTLPEINFQKATNKQTVTNYGQISKQPSNHLAMTKCPKGVGGEEEAGASGVVTGKCVCVCVSVSMRYVLHVLHNASTNTITQLTEGVG